MAQTDAPSPDRAASKDAPPPAPHRPGPEPGRTSGGGGVTRGLAIVATATASAFAGSALMSQTAVVPGWRALEPAAFLRRFPVSGPATGGTAFTFELASMVLLAATAYRTRSARRAERVLWRLSAASMGGTFVLLVYFLPANLALLSAAFAAGAVQTALATWNRWNWVRTGLGLAAAALATAAMVIRPAGDASLGQETRR